MKDVEKVKPEKPSSISFSRKDLVIQSYYPEQISAMILKNLKENAENFILMNPKELVQNKLQKLQD